MWSGKNMKRIIAVVTCMCMLAHSVLYAAEISEEARSLLSTAVMLAEEDISSNKDTIQVLLQTCLDETDGDALVQSIIDSVFVLLKEDSADPGTITALLNSLLQTAEEGGETDNAVTETEDIVHIETEASSAASTEVTATVSTEINNSDIEVSVGSSRRSESGLPVYEVSSFIQTIIRDMLLIDVPGDWGNNGFERTLITFSPVNDSGAISPAAGTLSISYFPMEEEETEAAFDSYVKNISDMSVVSGVTTEDTTAASLPARRLDFTMNVGANQFACETICFAYENIIFAIELMQGQQTEYDYFGVYDQVIDSAQIGDESDILPSEEPVQSENPETPEESIQSEETVPPGESETPEEPASTEGPLIVEKPLGGGETEAIVETAESGVQESGAAAVNPELPDDIGSFMYELDGKVYEFPTAVMDLDSDALQLDRTLELPYDFSSDADMAGGTWTELVNTQYYYFENALYKEMAGVSNMQGYPVPMSEGIVTALIDTQGAFVNLTLPGGIKVGSPESDIVRGFPEFSGRALDGLAGFRDNELLYACNIRDDGCHGYVLIRNNDPYYSAVSIICDEGIVKEISFECIGSVRATGVFL